MKKLRMYSRVTGFLSIVFFVGAQSGVQKPCAVSEVTRRRRTSQDARQFGTLRIQINRQIVLNVSASYVHGPVGWK